MTADGATDTSKATALARSDATGSSGSDLDYDYLIIGSGFGGSVTALRLIEKGYRVLMLEKGRELKADDFPETNWNLKRWLWAPSLGFRGLFRWVIFRHVTVLAGVGVGGGSLVYANTLPIPKQDFFTSASWGHLADWERELAPHYQTARRVLGAEPTHFRTPPDRLLQEIAKERGTPEAFGPTHVAVYFGQPSKTVPDPYFDGEGPERTGCNLCGACMTGCRHNAKNTLDKNYLFLARKHGLELQPDTEVTHVSPLPGGGYRVSALQGARRWFRKKRSFTARNVVFSGGALGTNELLLKLKQDPQGLPKLSDRLGQGVRTNSESLIFATTPKRDEDLSRGVAIGSILQTDDHSHLEVVRYGAGSGFFRSVAIPHVGGKLPSIVRLMKSWLTALRHPWLTLRTFLVPDWAKQTIILLYMRTLDGTLRFRRPRLLGKLAGISMATDLDSGEPPQATMAEADELAERMAAKIGGMAMSSITEAVTNTATTAHILGGACMGDSPETGVIDHAHQVFNYPGLYVIDGSAISANPGVNPSLTICALAERAMELVPVKAGKTRLVLPARARAAEPLALEAPTSASA